MGGYSWNEKMLHRIRQLYRAFLEAFIPRVMSGDPLYIEKAHRIPSKARPEVVERAA